MNSWRRVFDHPGPPRYGFRTQLFESTRSGLHVLIADVPGPMVQCMVTLRTETNDDRGLPHTLEHLCFLGSARYPHKGLLDLLSQSILSDGTNAWTAQDHTCFTLCAASREGVMGVAPIYLEHIFTPLLHDGHYGMEVFAINGTGHETGVVFR